MIRSAVSRRSFIGSAVTAAGYLSVGRPLDLWGREIPADLSPQDNYDAMAKLAFNENPYGPPESVMKAMTAAFKYANRYGYPDGDIVEVIAQHHGVKTENVMLGAGSGEILDVVGSAFLEPGKKVLGVEPSYTSVYQHATSIRADAIRIPLGDDYSQDIPAMIKATRTYYREIGFVYLCNPNNPTGRVVTAAEVKQLLDGIPEDMPVLIDEAYHHYVEHPGYATSVPYVLEGRPVIVARTFSKIVGLAGMRLGYGIAPRPLLQRMRPHSTGSINALVKWGGVAALQDTQAQDRVRRVTLELRKKTTSELEARGYPCIPSETNFFMVGIRREVQPVIAEFRKRGVAVGRPFPPMTQHLRVSIGTPEELGRFMTAFKEIFPAAVGARG